MKKLTLLLGMLLTVAMVAAGCGTSVGNTENGGDKTESGAAVATEGETAGNVTGVVTGGELKTGLATITTISDSKDAAEEEGIAQADVTIAAVTVDAEGKIAACRIDIAQTKIYFGKDGTIFSDLAAEYPSKQELGDSYGMKAASSIEKEWNEQADAFAAYCVGKTADEVTGIAVTDEGTAADTDLAASCTMHIGGFQSAVAKAVNNATAVGAADGDLLGLGVTTNIAKSAAATKEVAGVAQAYTTISVVTVNGEGKITSAIIDAVQANINFDVNGKIISDLTAEVSSKNELGDSYGMKSASSIGKEWNEQAAAYAAYAAGKTIDEVNGTAVAEGVPSDADLAASVTIHIGDFNTVLTKAVNGAK